MSRRRGATAGTNVKALGPGSFSTEPAGAVHFARTDAKPVILCIHGLGKLTAVTSSEPPIPGHDQF